MLEITYLFTLLVWRLHLSQYYIYNSRATIPHLKSLSPFTGACGQSVGQDHASVFKNTLRVDIFPLVRVRYVQAGFHRNLEIQVNNSHDNNIIKQIK